MKLPIVDENDTQIALKERDEIAHEDIYRVSALWITNSDGKILLAQRALSKKKDPGMWGGAVAGTVEEDETYESNILKEIAEELGITLGMDDLRIGPKFFRETPSGRYFSQWYLATVDKELEEFTIPEDEVMALRWVTAEDLRKEIEESPDSFIPSAPLWIGTFI